jgi:cell division protein FtsQ
MARKSGSTIVQEELYTPPNAARSHNERAREEHVRDEQSRDEIGSAIDDARLVDLDVGEESPFLRAQKRVSARRGALPPKTANRLLWAAVAAAAVCAGGLATAAIYRYGERSWRFRVESSDNIEVAGSQNVTKSQIMEVMGADIGRNIFFIPLAQQKAQLEQIAWVESASVMRFVPNHLRVEIHERTPVAFARVGPRIFLVDAGGTLMELSTKHKYSFPVILGMNPGEPLSTRAPRMKEYAELVHDLDSGGARYSQDLSEVDLSDLDDLKVRVNDPAGDVLVHLGSANFLARYKVYVSHAQEWRQQFQKLESVDLRYDNQIIVNPDLPWPARQAALSPAAAKAAAAAGVKPAALLSRIGSRDKAVPKPAFELQDAKLNPSGTSKPTAKRPAKRSVHSGSAGVSPSVPRASTPLSRRSRRLLNSRRDGGSTSATKPATSKSAGQKPSPAIARTQTNPGAAQ